MTAEKLANAILKKCDIYYGDALISKEAIIEKYLSFLPIHWYQRSERSILLFIQDLCALMLFPLLPSLWGVYPIICLQMTVLSLLYR